MSTKAHRLLRLSALLAFMQIFISRLRVLLARLQMNAQDSRPMRRLFAALSTTWMLLGAFAPAVLAASCDRPASTACCESSRPGAQGAQIACCAPRCACDEFRMAPSSPVAVPERRSAPAPFAILTSLVAALPVRNLGLEGDLQPRPPDLSSALGPPLRLRI